MAEKMHQIGKGNHQEMLSRLGIAVEVPPLPEPLILIEKTQITKKPQDYTWNHIKTDLQAAVSELTANESVYVTEARVNVPADFALACHRLASAEKKSPQQIAQNLAEKFSENNQLPEIKTAKADNGYLNFELDPKPFANKVIKEIEESKSDYGNQNIGEGKTIVMDCSSPNIAKFMSVGHLRSTVIGESLARLYKANGYTVIRDNHLGDWGTQFGMLGRAYDLWSDEIPELKTGKDTVQGLYKLYVKMHEEVEKQKEENPDQESTLEREGRAWFRRLEEGDPKALEMLNWSTKQSLGEFQRIYDLLGARFEYMLGESYYVKMLPSVFISLAEKKVTERDEEGAVAVNFQDSDKLSRLVVQKSDGTSLYASRDLAALAARTKWFDPEKIIYVVGGDQTEYFKQVFKTFENWTEGKGPKAEHVGFGMISLPEGKMSTRRGRVVFLEEVLEEAITRAKKIIDEKSSNLTGDEKEKAAQQVGVGAVIYFDLGQGRERNIKFDWDTALSMDGNSAPYIQYTYARSKAIERKAQENKITVDQKQEVDYQMPVETTLVKHLARFPDAVARSIEENKPSIVAEYTYKTADIFNQFYKQAAIAVEPDPAIRNSRLRLSTAAGQVIKNGLYLLGIQTPDRM